MPPEFDHGNTWVLGSGGLLGSAVVERLGREAWLAGPIIWNGPHVLDRVADYARRFIDSSSSEDWSVVWCAGAGIAGTTEQRLAAETEILAAVLDALPSDGEGRFFLASSAGGIHAGAHDLPITESSAPAPLSAYGDNKLRQEALVSDWAARSGNAAVIGRIANLYGPGQSLSKGQGLITRVAYLTMMRRPVPVFVSLDTLRDYIYSLDCADLVLDMLHTDRVRPATATTKILCSGVTRSVAEILAEVGRVLGRRPSFVQGTSAATRAQGRTLRFHSTVWTELDRRSYTPLPHGIHCVVQELRKEIGRGERW